MICLCVGTDVEWFLRRVEAGAELYSQVTICSPFVDEQVAERLMKLAASLEFQNCGFELITGSQAAVKFKGRLPRARQTGWRRLISCRHLHAKVYLAIGRNPKNSLVLITSANATRAALTKNIELGVLVTGSTAESAQFIHEAQLVLQKLALPRRKHRWIRR